MMGATVGVGIGVFVAATLVSVGMGSAVAVLAGVSAVGSADCVSVETAVSGSAGGGVGEGASSDWQAIKTRNKTDTVKKRMNRVRIGGCFFIALIYRMINLTIRLRTTVWY
jgi:hypothetical protein